MENRYKCRLDTWFDPEAASASIRPNGIYLNSSATQLAGFHKYISVTAERDHQEYEWSSALYLKGSHEKASCEYLAFSNDSRGKEGKGPRYISCKRLISQFPALKALAQEKRENARITVSYNEKTKELKIPIAPMLEQVKYRPEDLPTAPGVYAYCQGNEVVYYGKGKSIYDRGQEDTRKNWQFDSIRFSYVPSENNRTYYENIFLEKYKSKNGCLPRYNLISGSNRIREVAV